MQKLETFVLMLPVVLVGMAVGISPVSAAGLGIGSDPPSNSIATAEVSTATAISSVRSFMWGGAFCAQAPEIDKWTAQLLPFEALGAEVSLARPGTTVWHVVGCDQLIVVKGPVREESFSRTIEAFVDTSDAVVLKLLLLDTSRNASDSRILEPLAPSLCEDLRRGNNEEWLAAVSPSKTCLVDIFGAILGWGLSIHSIADASRIVVHGVRCSLGVAERRRELAVWSVDFRDGSTLPKAAPEGMPPVSNMRYTADLDTGKLLGATNNPMPRGCLEAAIAQDQKDHARLQSRRAAIQSPPVDHAKQPPALVPEGGAVPTDQPPPKSCDLPTPSARDSTNAGRTRSSPSNPRWVLPHSR